MHRAQKVPLATSDSDEAERLTVSNKRPHMMMITHSVHTKSGVAANHADCIVTVRVGNQWSDPSIWITTNDSFACCAPVKNSGCCGLGDSTFFVDKKKVETPAHMFTSSNNQHNSILNFARLYHWIGYSRAAPAHRIRETVLLPDFFSPEAARTRRIRE